MKPIKKIEFTAEVVKEYSYTAKVESLGQRKCAMTLFTADGTLDSGRGAIEWLLDVGTPNEQYGANIGLWWDDGKNLADYDGLMSLPAEAKRLLRKCGLHVSNDF